jgi:hypothetical protein
VLREAVERKRKEKMHNVVPQASPPAIDPSTVETLHYDPYGEDQVDNPNAESPKSILINKADHPYFTENSWWKVERYNEENHTKRQVDGESDQQALDPCDKIPSHDQMDTPSPPATVPERDQPTDMHLEPKDVEMDQKTKEPQEKKEFEEKKDETEEQKEAGETQEDEVEEEEPEVETKDPEMVEEQKSQEAKLESVEKMPEVKKMAPESMNTDHVEPEVTQEAVVAVLEHMLKEGLDLSMAIHQLKGGMLETKQGIPIVDRIKQFQLKNLNKPGPESDETPEEEKKPAKHKARGKAKAKAAAKPKAAGRRPRAKAKAKAKAEKAAKASAAEEIEDDDVEVVDGANDEEKSTENTTMEEEQSNTKPGDAKAMDKPDKEENHVKDTEEDKPKKKRKDHQEPGDEGAKKPKTAKSFARRVCPSTSPAKDKYLAIMEVFKTEIQDKLKENGEKISKWEDRGYI